jgi:transposase-like protein
MTTESHSSKVAGSVKLRCLCGKTHSFVRTRIVEQLGRKRWKCITCKRRFIVACTPAADHKHEKFWPIFLDDVPSWGDTQEVGLVLDGAEDANVPPQLQFECRCGCRLMGQSRIYGKRTRCPKCDARIIVRVGYDGEHGKPVALLEFVE